MPLKRRASKNGKEKENSKSAKYSDASFLGVVRKSFRAIGETTVKQALTLYQVLKDERTPAAARLTIVGALAYLILPTDVIPDFIPLAGFTDDAGAIAAALMAVARNIKPEHKRKAEEKAKDLFS